MASAKLRRNISTRSGTINVSVEQKLEDILVVSYSDGAAIFRGVLMNTTKQNVPCGIDPPPDLSAPSSPPKARANAIDECDEDKLSTVSRRMTYFWSSSGSESLENLICSTDAAEGKFNLRRTIKLPAKYRDTRGGRLGVRLRPRNVLCSKCRSVCDEKSRNVTANGRGNATTSSTKLPSPTTRTTRSSAQVDASATADLRTFRTKPCRVSLSLLRTAESTGTASASSRKGSSNGAENLVAAAPKLSSTKKLDFTKFHPVPVKCVSEGEESNANLSLTTVITDPATGVSGRRSTRKRVSVGAMEDLWDEEDFGCGERRAASTSQKSPKKKISSNAATAENKSTDDPGRECKTVIKISIGSNGQHVLKIPTRQFINASEPNSEEDHHSEDNQCIDYADFPSSSESTRVHKSKRKKKKNKSSRDDEKRRNKKLAKLAERAYELGYVEPDRDPLALDVPEREDMIGVDDYKIARSSEASVFVVPAPASPDDVIGDDCRGGSVVEPAPDLFIRSLDVAS